jgi:hypothetical protein
MSSMIITIINIIINYAAGWSGGKALGLILSPYTGYHD